MTAWQLRDLTQRVPLSRTTSKSTLLLFTLKRIDDNLRHKRLIEGIGLMADIDMLTIADIAADIPYSTQIGPFGKALTPEDHRVWNAPS